MPKKVLIIEDDESNLKILELSIKQMGCVVCTAKNGEEGLQYAQETRPDLIIMDMMMPKMSGMDVLKKIKSGSDLESIPILIVSAKAAKKDAAHALKAGATEFITKPFHVKEIQEIVSKYLIQKDS